MSRSSASQSPHKQSVILSVTVKREYFINKGPVPQGKLEVELAAACAGLHGPTVVIYAPGTLSIQALVNVMQIGAHRKIKMVLATKKE